MAGRMVGAKMPTPSNVIPTDFGTAAQRNRAKLADQLEEIAGNIRRGEMQDEPTGWVLGLFSETNPEGIEFLNLGINYAFQLRLVADAAYRRARESEARHAAGKAPSDHP